MTQPSASRKPGRLGRYEIVDELGKGAMGVVYLARDPLIGRLVALKTFRVGYSIKDQELEQFRARFIREAQSAGILSHPGIVTIHDVVEESEEGVAFIAMEYVRGTNLKMLLQRQGPLDLQLAWSIVDQVAEALDYAHSRGVVHRDIKPANVILTADNRVKITDFGIARLDTSNLTQEGQLLGTPNYMAPEQILGKEVDHRADIFSLGIVLYEMLTRHKPFQGDNLTVVSHRIVYDHFTPPRQYVEDLPPGVERVLARALDKEPAQRYQRAKELAEDLRRVAHPEPEPAGEGLNETQSLSATAAAWPEPEPPPAAPPAPSLRERLAARPSWERLASTAWVAALAAVLVGAVALLSLGWGPVPPPTPAEQARGEVMPLMTEGHRLLQQARFEEAAAAFARAERLAPGLPGPRRMREQAEDHIPQLDRLVEQQKRIREQLAQADLALTKQDYEVAVLAATAVLALEPDNQRARDVLTRALESRGGDERPLRNRSEPRRTGGPQVAERPSALEPVPAPAQEVSTAIVPTRATLTFHLTSALPKGTFRLMRDGTTVDEGNFDFYQGQRRLFFRKRVPKPGEVIHSLALTPGPAKLMVIVTPENGVATTGSVTAQLAGGSRHRLNVVLNDQGRLSAFLEDLSGGSPAP